MSQTWDLNRQRDVMQSIDGFQTWTQRWSLQMEQFYEDWLESMLLLESRSQFGIRLTELERDQLFQAIERAQLHDLLRQHVEHVQAYLERLRERHEWLKPDVSASSVPQQSLYPFVRAVDVLTSIVGKSINRMNDELEYWQNVFTQWTSDQELYKVWPEMDLRFSDMDVVLSEGKVMIQDLRRSVEADQVRAHYQLQPDVEQAVLEELEPLMKRLRSVYERQFASQVVDEFELTVGSEEGHVELFVDLPDDDSCHFVLSDNLSIYSIKAEHRRFMSEFQPSGNQTFHSLKLDGSEVNDVDASGIQLILSIANTCKARGIPFQLTDPSDILTHWLERAGAVEYVK